MASLGYLSIYKVMAVAFFGTLIADQTLYMLGRYYGDAFLNRFPRFKEPADRAFSLLHRWDSWFILSNRFIYGIRTISPFIIGAGGVSPRRFIPLNFIAAIVWTVVSCVGGYLLTGAILSNFHLIQKYFLFAIITVVALVSGFMYWRKRK